MSKIWGIRYDDRDYKIGEELPESRVWDNGVKTDELLSGTSAMLVSDETDFLDYLDGKEDADCGELGKYNKAISRNYYDGKHIYLLMGDTDWGFEHGEDEGEVILTGAEVARIIR
jgi:hypothetical protein